MALGAPPQKVVRLFLKQGLVVILIGSAAGGVLGFTTTRLLNAWLFGVRPSDPATFLLAMSILLTVVLPASYIPARRATNLDPMVALRCE
jgi:putative ABC transport system permease protein